MRPEKNDKDPNSPTDDIADADAEKYYFDATLAQAHENADEDDEETAGGVGQQNQQRTIARRLTSLATSRKTSDSDEESTGGLETMGISALTASYAAYATAHAMLAEQHSHDGKMLDKLNAIRGALKKQCTDLAVQAFLPLLAHANPYVHVTAAIDLLFSVFKTKDRAVEVLNIARGGGRGFLPFAAGFALETYFHTQVLPPEKIMKEATRLYNQLPRSIVQFNGKFGAPLPLPEKVVVRDGNPHTGRFISLADKNDPEKYYAQHVGMNEYQLYRGDQLTAVPQDGEQYHVARDGGLRRIAEHVRTKARGKI